MNKKVLVVGSGPIIIGQAAEFDYSGSQACLALKELDYEVILVNPNPATIMTDKEIAHKVYMEPITVEFLAKIIAKERPKYMLPSLGGQMALNIALKLAAKDIFTKYDVSIMGTTLKNIEQAEDRELFKQLMLKIKEPVPASQTVSTIQAAIDFATKIDYPLIIRPAYTLGGSGGGVVYNEEELQEVIRNGLDQSPIRQCLVEKSISGYKEIEFEVLRDQNDTTIAICSMENFDPVGIHTGDSIVVAPIQTLSNNQVQMLRDVSLKVVRALKIVGGCNVQLALNPTSDEYYIIEVNPRVSRSSALASKATGYPIAKIAAEISTGLLLDEIYNPVTKTTYAAFEPTLDYIVAKIARFPFDKFKEAEPYLGTQMKATGEVMSLGTNFEEAILKAIRGLEIGTCHLSHPEFEQATKEELLTACKNKHYLRIFAIYKLLQKQVTVEEIYQATQINQWFLYKLQHLVNIEKTFKLEDINSLKNAKKYGFSDEYLAKLLNVPEEKIYELRQQHNIIPIYKMVDTCAGEFASTTPYFYSTYGMENESIVSKKQKILIIGSGPIRIGQGVEFDYATVHAIKTISKLGYEAIVVNNNPETVSTDFSISDKLYFEPITVEDVMNIVELEQVQGIIIQYGGQTAINLGEKLKEQNKDVKILGTSLRMMQALEDRDLFEQGLQKIQVKQPQGSAVNNLEQALIIANNIGYPVLVRPSFVLGGQNMKIIYEAKELKEYFAGDLVNDKKILIDKYLLGQEVEVDVICDGQNILIPAILEHLESAGIHSGDSIAIYPSKEINVKHKQEIIKISQKIAQHFQIVGLMNIQFIIFQGEIYVIEVNPRASRTLPFISKITKHNLAQISAQVIMGKTLKDQGYTQELLPEPKIKYIKAPVFSFDKFSKINTLLSPEMKSTGEAIGIDSSYLKALNKALISAKINIPAHGAVLFTVDNMYKEQIKTLAQDLERMGFMIYGTKGTAKYLREVGVRVEDTSYVSEQVKGDISTLIENKKIDLIINLESISKQAANDGEIIRIASTKYRVPCFTSIDTAKSIVKLIKKINYEIMEV
ncbi:MAG: carbamoyl-phosphate synthase large subunit [Mycoplasmatales bacterium]